MKAESEIVQEIEELRRRLHKAIGSRYDPDRVQMLRPISREIDRLTLELTRLQTQVPAPAGKVS